MSKGFGIVTCILSIWLSLFLL